MDERTFDRWATSMAQRPTRRASLRLLAGGLLGGLLAWRRVAPTRAHNHCGGCPPGHFCSAGGVCLVEQFPLPDPCLAQGLHTCGGRCVNLQNDSRNCGVCGVRCEPAVHCRNGVCDNPPPTCPPGQTFCGETCTDLRTDRWNCGACGNQCAQSEVCEDGICQSRCALLGLTDCFGVCVNLRTDPEHCGACNLGCYPPGARCINGEYCED